MHVVEVIPVGRGMNRMSLSYFSGTAFERGTILSIPLRKGTGTGIVTDCTEVGAAKAALRAATFSLRKIPPQDHTTVLPRALLHTADTLAEYYASSIGAVLFSLLPQEYLADPSRAQVSVKKPGPHEKRAHVHYILQAPTKERYVHYQKIIREAFANKHSVVLVAPTIADVTYATDVLKVGIEAHVISIYGSMGTKAILGAYERLQDSLHPKLIITTPQHGIVERDDVETVILEHSRGKGYRAHIRPYLDYKKALLTHSALLERTVISGDTLIATEDEWLIREERAEPFGEHPKRIDLPGNLDVLLIAEKPTGTTPFSIFSKKLLTAIDKTLKKKERVFLLAARRGLAPVIACADCGHILRDPESGAPLSLHRRTKNGAIEHWVYSSVSGFRERAPDLCPHCGSWRLKERGIGIQHVYDELKKHVTEDTIILFDHTTARTPKKARELQERFYTKKGCILLGTTLALPYLKEPIAYSALVSMDGLRAIPTWRGDEETLTALLSLREITTGTVLIQTRNPDNEILEHAKKGSVALFYDEELNSRATYHYPPHTTFIHLTWQGTKHVVDQMTREVEMLFADDTIAVYGFPPKEHEQQQNITSRQGLIRVSSHLWPHDYIIDKIRKLPPAVRVMINPDRIV